MWEVTMVPISQIIIDKVKQLAKKYGIINGLKLDMLPNKFDKESSWVAGENDNDQNITYANKEDYNDNKQYKQNEQPELIIQDSNTNENIQDHHGQIDIPTDNSVSEEEITTWSIMNSIILMA